MIELYVNAEILNITLEQLEALLRKCSEKGIEVELVNVQQIK